MKLNRCDLLALIVLGAGLALYCFGPTPDAQDFGRQIAKLGAVGCAITFLF